MIIIKLNGIWDGKINLVADDEPKKHRKIKCWQVVWNGDKICLVANETMWKKLLKKVVDTKLSKW